MPVDETLRKLGLSRQEADIYVATLKLGTAKASEIAQKCTMARGAVYYTLKLLREKAFISEVVKSGVKYYSATSPKRLLERIDEEQAQKRELVHSILPELQALQSTSLSLPQVELYEGTEGFKSIFAKILEQDGQQLRCFLSGSILAFMPQFHVQFRRRRKEHSISIRTITERSPEMDAIRALDAKELRVTRYNNLMKNKNVLYYILNDAVIIVKANKVEQMALYVKEKEFVEFQKALFEKVWQEST
ncbi:TPA: hypothetical protein HA251_00870 [Candidatus Woesearchaeota archaeon]|nr:hypothetical protein [Candidatus Woesearchaeota archaeon]